MYLEGDSRKYRRIIEFYRVRKSLADQVFVGEDDAIGLDENTCSLPERDRIIT